MSATSQWFNLRFLFIAVELNLLARVLNLISRDKNDTFENRFLEKDSYRREEN